MKPPFRSTEQLEALGLYDDPTNIIDDYVKAEQGLIDALPDTLDAAQKLVAALEALHPTTEGLPPGSYTDFSMAFESLKELIKPVISHGGTAALYGEDVEIALEHAPNAVVDSFRNRPLEPLRQDQSF